MKYLSIILSAMVFAVCATVQSVSDFPAELEQTVVNYTYDASGNLLSRTDLKRNITERFGYDGLNRLTSYGDCTVEYDPNGNILRKSDAGSFSYASGEKPYAITRARLYDPVLGRFLSPDPYVQDPAMPQNFNRYSYCLNNPFCYVDKDGQFVFLPILAGAAIGGTLSGISAVRQGQNFFNGSYVNPPAAPAPKSGNLSKNVSVQDLPQNATSLTNPVSENTNIRELANRLQPEIRPVASEANLKNTYSVYFGRDSEGNIRYVGITNRSVEVREAEHLASKTERATLNIEQ